MVEREPGFFGVLARQVQGIGTVALTALGNPRRAEINAREVLALRAREDEIIIDLRDRVVAQHQTDMVEAATTQYPISVDEK